MDICTPLACSPCICVVLHFVIADIASSSSFTPIITFNTSGKPTERRAVGLPCTLFFSDSCDTFEAGSASCDCAF